MYALFLTGGSLYTFAPPPEYKWGQAHWYNYHYCCPECGDVWAHAVEMNADYRHAFLTVRCKKCGDGSLDNYFVDGWAESLPLRFLADEVLNQMKENGI